MAYDALPSRRARGYSYYGAFASFSIACFILTLMTDLAYWATAGFQWETMSVWLLTVGLVSGVFATVAGIVDLVRSRTVAGLTQPWLALVGQAIAFGLSLLNVFVHSRDGYTAVVPEGLGLSIVVVLVLLVTTIMGRAMAARAKTGGFA